MRTEQQMLNLIVETARCDERIRAVIMNGSRANPNAPRDVFQDFDIVYIVTDVDPFKNNLEWIKRFGELMILQMPEDMLDPPPNNDGSLVYLMQFTDGNRIDLGIIPLEKLNEIGRDSLSLLLLDKDGMIEPFAPPSEGDYLPRPPTAKAFSDCCNEFWWCCPYVAKGLWRGEIIYAKQILEQFVRAQLMKMLVWHIGLKTGFSHNPGKLGKYFQQYLEPELWDMLLKTYVDANYDHTWEALFTMCNLFRTLALPIAEHYGFLLPPCISNCHKYPPFLGDFSPRPLPSCPSGDIKPLNPPRAPSARCTQRPLYPAPVVPNARSPLLPEYSQVTRKCLDLYQLNLPSPPPSPCPPVPSSLYEQNIFVS